MKKEELFEIIGEVDEQKVADAGCTMTSNKKVYFIWYKWIAVAVCLCIVVVGGIGFNHMSMKQYVVKNNISVYSTIEYGDGISGDDVTPEQADCLAKANYIHNTLTAQKYEWYGNCYYDFGNDKIMVGLTEISGSNRKTILKHIGDTIVEFEQCDYSYQYLEQLYYKLEEKRIVLSMLGVDRFNISIEKNRVNVHIVQPDKYGAIYVANKMDDMGGAIIFSSDIATEHDNGDSSY